MNRSVDNGQMTSSGTITGADGRTATVEGEHTRAGGTTTITGSEGGSGTIDRQNTAAGANRQGSFTNAAGETINTDTTRSGTSSKTDFETSGGASGTSIKNDGNRTTVATERVRRRVRRSQRQRLQEDRRWVAAVFARQRLAKRPKRIDRCSRATNRSARAVGHRRRAARLRRPRVTHEWIRLRPRLTNDMGQLNRDYNARQYGNRTYQQRSYGGSRGGGMRGGGMRGGGGRRR